MPSGRQAERKKLAADATGNITGTANGCLDIGYAEAKGKMIEDATLYVPPAEPAANTE